MGKNIKTVLCFSVCLRLAELCLCGILQNLESTVAVIGLSFPLSQQHLFTAADGFWRGD